MDWGHLRRRAIALAAAYAVSLQMLLSAALPVAPAGAALRYAELCAKDDRGGKSHPINHDPLCAGFCTALGQGIGGMPPSRALASVFAPVVVALVAAPNDWVPPSVVIGGSYAPRGPPRV